LFNLPLETFLAFIPWPFIWLTFAIVMYFKLKKEDDREEQMNNRKEEID